jgi:hypothetical protein
MSPPDDPKPSPLPPRMLTDADFPDEGDEPIPAGQAQARLLAATSNLAAAEGARTNALSVLIATAQAIGRALDATAATKT